MDKPTRIRLAIARDQLANAIEVSAYERKQFKTTFNSTLVRLYYWKQIADGLSGVC